MLGATHMVPLRTARWLKKLAYSTMPRCNKGSLRNYRLLLPCRRPCARHPSLPLLLATFPSRVLFAVQMYKDTQMRTMIPTSHLHFSVQYHPPRHHRQLSLRLSWHLPFHQSPAVFLRPFLRPLHPHIHILGMFLPFLRSSPLAPARIKLKPTRIFSVHLPHPLSRSTLPRPSVPRPGQVQLSLLEAARLTPAWGGVHASAGARVRASAGPLS